MRGRQESQPEEEGREGRPEMGQCAEKAEEAPSVKEHSQPQDAGKGKDGHLLSQASRWNAALRTPWFQPQEARLTLVVWPPAL